MFDGDAEGVGGDVNLAPLALVADVVPGREAPVHAAGRVVGDAIQTLVQRRCARVGLSVTKYKTLIQATHEARQADVSGLSQSFR